MEIRFLSGIYLTLPNLLYTFFDVVISSRTHSLEFSWIERVIRIALSKVLKTAAKSIGSAYSRLQRSVASLLPIENLLKGFGAALCINIEPVVFNIGFG